MKTDTVLDSKEVI